MDVKDYEKIPPEVVDEMLTDIAKNSDVNHAMLKVIEELSEAQVVLTKMLTKPKDKRPSTLDLVEELGDVLFRINVLAKAIDLEDDIQARAYNKIRYIHEAFVSGKIPKTTVVISKQ
jgi:hypothetical protein